MNLKKHLHPMAKCTQCQSPFAIPDRDNEFRLRISPTFDGQKFPMPPPHLCPLCRMQRRMTWRGELHLFKRKSALSGKEIITFYPPSSKAKVITRDEFYSDDWNPLEFGRDFDFTRPFFEQFRELVLQVPLMGLSCKSVENSDYINCASWAKNCYLMSGCNHSEDCFYGNYVNHSRSCVDCNFVRKCELCYECIDCTNCFHIKWSQNCHGCSDSTFLHGCRNCRNCFGCVNLVNKEYHFKNEQLSKTEYEKKILDLKLDTRSAISELKKWLKTHCLEFPNKFYLGEMNENVTGHGVIASRNSFDCFDVSELEDCSYCVWLHQSKNCQDVFAWGFPAELCYECTEAGDGSYQAVFCVSSYNNQRVFYCYYPHMSQDCFGCVSVKRAKYCVFNKQYSASEYEKLVAKIISHMQQTGEWGEFFPITTSPLAYNTSVAQDYFPLEESACKHLGWPWETNLQATVISDKDAPPIQDSISQSDESICDKTFRCKISGRAFRITKPEYKFYRELGIPLPDICFWERHKARLNQRNPRQLWERTCQNCDTPLVTSYPPYRPDKVHCENCYLSGVY